MKKEILGIDLGNTIIKHHRPEVMANLPWQVTSRILFNPMQEDLEKFTLYC